MARVGTGKYSHRVPYESVSFDDGLPLIADVQAVLPVARGVRLDQLQPADPVRHAEQERRRTRCRGCRSGRPASASGPAWNRKPPRAPKLSPPLISGCVWLSAW